MEQVSSNASAGRLLCCSYCQCLYVDPADGVTTPYSVDNVEAARWMAWGAGDVLAAVRSTLGQWGADSGWTFESAALEGEMILVVFLTEDQSRYGVRYDLTQVPVGQQRVSENRVVGQPGPSLGDPRHVPTLGLGGMDRLVQPW
jgi:hypothetical protein